MHNKISRTLLSLKGLWAYQHRKALVIFRVAQDSVWPLKSSRVIYTTRLHREHKPRELEILQRLLSESVTPDDHCARLLTHSVSMTTKSETNFGGKCCLVLRACTTPGSFILVCLHHKRPDAGLCSRNLLADIKPDSIMVDLDLHWTTKAVNRYHHPYLMHFHLVILSLQT